MEPRTLNTIDDLFFDEDNIYCNLGRDDDGSEYLHGYCIKIPDDGLLQKTHHIINFANNPDLLLTV